MPFRYRLQKILEIRIRKKEEQMQVVIKAQEEVRKIEFLIIQNKEEINRMVREMRSADPMMYERYDTFIKHLWDEDERLQNRLKEAQENLRKEQELLRLREQEVNVLDKHKENKKEEYIQEEKARELKELNEIGSQKAFFRRQEQNQEENQE